MVKNAKRITVAICYGSSNNLTGLNSKNQERIMLKTPKNKAGVYLLLSQKS